MSDLCVDTLSQFASAMCHRNGATFVIDGNQAVIVSSAPANRVTHGYHGNSPFPLAIIAIKLLDDNQTIVVRRSGYQLVCNGANVAVFDGRSSDQHMAVPEKVLTLQVNRVPAGDESEMLQNILNHVNRFCAT